jgi:glycosyltransferase involved in cell wall biosynthesis
MRIGLLIYGSLKTLSGGYLYDRQLVDYLHGQGDQVTVISLPWRTYFRHLGDNFSARFQGQLSQLNIDVLFQDELNHPSLFRLNQRLKPNIDYPIVSIVHHLRSSELRPEWKNRLYLWVERRYLKSIDGFVFNSQTTRQVVEGLVGKGKPGVVAIPGGDRLGANLTEAQIVARARQPGPLRIFFLGNLIPRKGLHNLLAALTSLPSHLWELTVTGSPEVDRSCTPSPADCRRRVVERVNFTGPLPEAELVRTLETNKSWRCLIVRGYGIAYLEGWASASLHRHHCRRRLGDHHAGCRWFTDRAAGRASPGGNLKQLAEDREMLAELSRGTAAAAWPNPPGSKLPLVSGLSHWNSYDPSEFSFLRFLSSKRASMTGR